MPRMRGSDDYDAIAHLSSNENCWGPPESVMKAMNNAWKYSNRYGYPDANIVGEIAKHHGVKPENILLGAGSGEILDVVGTTFLLGGKKVLGVEPSYSSVYQHATSIKTTAIKLPLGKDYRQDMAAMIKAANDPRVGDRARVSVQPEQPDRYRRLQAGSQTAAGRHPEGHAGADRRGVPSFRRRSEATRRRSRT
jgi:histidinol-phosphate/aromatic aminotransferase/cobyric acid decarboxylase-like protein